MLSNTTFMQADGTYCHILNDKIVFGQPTELNILPEMSHKNRNAFSLLMLTMYLFFIGIFSYLQFTGNFIDWLWLVIVLACVGGGVSLYLNRSNSFTDCIDRQFLKEVVWIKRNWGHSAVVFYFITKNGQKLRKVVNVYDSKEYEQAAENALKSANFI
jgi:hypothetical protein